jgi:hypothetical protein
MTYANQELVTNLMSLTAYGATNVLAWGSPLPSITNFLRRLKAARISSALVFPESYTNRTSNRSLYVHTSKDDLPSPAGTPFLNVVTNGLTSVAYTNVEKKPWADVTYADCPSNFWVATGATTNAALCRGLVSGQIYVTNAPPSAPDILLFVDSPCILDNPLNSAAHSQSAPGWIDYRDMIVPSRTWKLQWTQHLVPSPYVEIVLTRGTDQRPTATNVLTLTYDDTMTWDGSDAGGLQYDDAAAQGFWQKWIGNPVAGPFDIIFENGIITNIPMAGATTTELLTGWAIDAAKVLIKWDADPTNGFKYHQ